MKRSSLAVAVVLASMVFVAASAQAQPPETPAGTPPPSPVPSPTLQPPKVEYTPDYPAAPAEGIYVSDRGIVLSFDEQTRINKAAAKIKFTAGLPVYVVTIRSLEAMGVDPAVGIDAYATEVCKRWAIASAKDNRGVLMLLSRDDRQARVMLGAGWPAAQQTVAKKIADTTLQPALGTSKPGPGILSAVDEVGAMFAAAGYTSAMPGEAAPAIDGKIIAPSGGVQPTYVPPAPGFFASAGPLAWIGIAIAVLLVILIAAVLAKSSK